MSMTRKQAELLLVVAAATAALSPPPIRKTIEHLTKGVTDELDDLKVESPDRSIVDRLGDNGVG